MVSVRVQAPESDVVEELRVNAGQPVLIGRAPDPLQVSGTSREGVPGEMLPAIINSARVSANHAVAWLDDGALCLRDLASRNGTFSGASAGVSESIVGLLFTPSFDGRVDDQLSSFERGDRHCTDGQCGT